MKLLLSYLLWDADAVPEGKSKKKMMILSLIDQSNTKMIIQCIISLSTQPHHVVMDSTSTTLYHLNKIKAKSEINNQLSTNNLNKYTSQSKEPSKNMTSTHVWNSFLNLKRSKVNSTTVILMFPNKIKKITKNLLHLFKIDIKKCSILPVI